MATTLTQSDGYSIYTGSPESDSAGQLSLGDNLSQTMGKRDAFLRSITLSNTRYPSSAGVDCVLSSSSLLKPPISRRVTDESDDNRHRRHWVGRILFIKTIERLS